MNPRPVVPVSLEAPVVNHKRSLASRVAATAIAGILSLGALYAFFYYVPDLYGGFDGQGIKHHVIERLRWLYPFQFNSLNPYQGAANIWFTATSWLNPGYAVFAILSDLRDALPASYAIFAVIYAGAVFLFARTLAPALNRSTACAIGLFAALAVVPPFARIIGVFPIFELAPGGTYYVAIYLVLLSLLMRLGHGAAARQTGLAFSIAAITVFAIACDPMWMPLLFVSVAPFGAAALVADLDRRATITRALALAAMVTALYVLGVVDYVGGIAGYTSRLYFWQESEGIERTHTFVFFALQNSRGFWLAVLLAPGFVLAALRGPLHARVMAVACLVSMTGLIAYSFAFLTLRIPWPYPIPLYLEVMAIPVYLVVAVIGWSAAVRHADGGDLIAAVPPAVRTQMRVWAVPAALVMLACWSVVSFYPNDRPELAAIGAKTSAVEIVRILINETALEPGDEFRGSTAGTRGVSRLYDAYKAALGHALYYPDLWAQRVPTFHEYNQLASPSLYFLVSRLIGTPPFDPRNNTPYPDTSPKAIDVLRAFGVRFLLSERPLDIHATQRAHWNGLADDRGQKRGIDAFLYELPDPNLGGYSPTNVLPRTPGRDVLAEIGSAKFDFRRNVVLEQALDVALVAARDARLVFERGWAHITAQSDGASLLVLPIQFSHCLMTEGSPEVKLVRANFVQAGVLFRGTIDVRMNYRFSPFARPRCRNADIDDMDRAGLREEVRPTEPDWATFAPWSQYTLWQTVRGRFIQLVWGL
jgi:hypothetical protein